MTMCGGAVTCTAEEAASFFKKSRGNKNMRKRPADEEVEAVNDDEELGSVVLQHKKAKHSDGIKPNMFSSQQQRGMISTAAKKSATAQQQEEKPTFFYESSREIQTQSDCRATASLETETEFDKDARAIREKVLKQADKAFTGKRSQDEKLYQGIHGYTDHKAGFRREHTIAGEKAGGAHGPLRASAHIRWSVRFDYQPDICKDYKETGYCGYGDACKFMHDRGDYKSGWQMDCEWEDAEKRKKAKLAQRCQVEEEGETEDAEIDASLPSACLICRQPFIDPVVTSCKHYFCELCALKHHARNKRCFVCYKPMNGAFNTAFEILKKAAQEKVKAAAGQPGTKSNTVRFFSSLSIASCELHLGERNRMRH